MEAERVRDTPCACLPILPTRHPRVQPRTSPFLLPMHGMYTGHACIGRTNQAAPIRKAHMSQPRALYQGQAAHVLQRACTTASNTHERPCASLTLRVSHSHAHASPPIVSVDTFVSLEDTGCNNNFCRVSGATWQNEEHAKLICQTLGARVQVSMHQDPALQQDRRHRILHRSLDGRTPPP